MNAAKLYVFACLFAVLILCACTTTPHTESDENFTVQRLLILNDKGEILMVEERSVWGMPWIVYKDREFIKEGIDKLATSYGIEVSDVQLRGQFSYKYDYQPYVTVRNYYVVQYAGGNIKAPEGIEDVKWVQLSDAIDQTTVTSIKQITRQIMDHPNTVWGGSFMVSHVGDDHPTQQVEDFYPLFKVNP